MIIKYFLHFDSTKQAPLNSNFEAMGYTTFSSLLNLDTIFLLFVASSAMMISVGVINNTIMRFLNRENSLRAWFQRKEDQLFFGYMFRFIIESYIEITIASTINIQMLSFDTLGEKVSSIFAQVFGAVFILFPAWCFVFLLCSDPSTYQFQRRYGELTHELRAEKVLPRLFHFFFTLRRLTLALIAVQLREYPIIQLLLFQLISVLNISYLTYHQPFQEPTTNKLEIFNELCILMVGYTLFIYTDFIPDFELQILVGYVMIGITGFNFLGNLSVICFGMYQKLRQVWKYRQWYKAYWKLQLKQMCTPRPKRIPKLPEIVTGQEFANQPEHLAYNLSSTEQNLFATRSITPTNNKIAMFEQHAGNLDNDMPYSLDGERPDEMQESEYDQEEDDEFQESEVEITMSDNRQIVDMRYIDILTKPLPHQMTGKDPIAEYQAKRNIEGIKSEYIVNRQQKMEREGQRKIDNLMKF
ncbi:hypothetical protein FGO68_gene11214 [Halteria grandinella]|uniref:TRP C-terminal domain-containing protein n=1 Tax=Halteria grandinella TaxID=5974 RepID=A0A8J8P8I8_HALGN|nr:hypothetical protein FGO68_gene11214 [Halteria grandinella]